jgi:hypothetical protein
VLTGSTGCQQCLVKLVAHRLGVDSRGTKRRVKASDTEVHFRELDDVALVRAADLRDLLFALSPALSQESTSGSAYCDDVRTSPLYGRFALDQ